MHQTQIDVTNLLPKDYIEHEYFNIMLSCLDPDAFVGKKIVISHNYKELPFYGDNVIAILTAGDEKGIPPKYKDKIGLVFKHHLDKDKIGNVYHIPLTYVGGFNGDYSIPIHNRKHDVFFVGRDQKRLDFINALKNFQKLSNWDFCVKITGYKFMGGWPIEKYAKEMMNSKIVLSPRGAVRAECLRFTEAVKSGCAIITCKHPQVRVFKNCPAIYLSSWNDMASHVNRLLTQPNELNLIHEKMKKSWDDYFSPESIAEYINKIVRCHYDV